MASYVSPTRKRGKRRNDPQRKLQSLRRSPRLRVGLTVGLHSDFPPKGRMRIVIFESNLFGADRIH